MTTDDESWLSDAQALRRGLRLEAGDAVVLVDAGAGGRLAGLTIGGLDVLVARNHDAMQWGSYPMVPFAGRIRYGRFAFGGDEHQLPLNLGPHAIHGYGYTSSWDVIGDDTISWSLGAPWPWRGEVQQQFELDDASLRVTMSVTAHEPQPVMMGWHPWFRRRLDSGDELVFEMPAARMYERDHDGIPTGRLVAVPEGPWDDCFTDLDTEPVLRWGDRLTLKLSSSCDHWVVYSMPEHALCVEPQSGAPDVVNRVPDVVAAGECLRHSMTLRWA